MPCAYGEKGPLEMPCAYYNDPLAHGHVPKVLLDCFRTRHSFYLNHHSQVLLEHLHVALLAEGLVEVLTLALLNFRIVQPTPPGSLEVDFDS